MPFKKTKFLKTHKFNKLFNIVLWSHFHLKLKLFHKDNLFRSFIMYCIPITQFFFDSCFIYNIFLQLESV